MSKQGIFAGMTEQAIRERVVAEAVKHLGVKEGSIEHKKIVDIYNTSLPKLPRGYEIQYDDAWCAAFISYVGISLGISDVILPEVGCGAMIELYRKQGRWMEADDYVPSPGDLVMYDWDAKKGECTGNPDHVGLVVSVEGKTITVIEGNYEDRVQYRTICVEFIKTRGFCLPDYASLVHGFSDVPAVAWYAKDVNRAAELGIVEGVGGGLFDPERPITRAEATVMLMRLYDELKK